jgi:hypothetical protein
MLRLQLFIQTFSLPSQHIRQLYAITVAYILWQYTALPLIGTKRNAYGSAVHNQTKLVVLPPSTAPFPRMSENDGCVRRTMRAWGQLLRVPELQNDPKVCYNGRVSDKPRRLPRHQRAQAHNSTHTVRSSVLCSCYVVNKTVSCVLMNMILVAII